MALLELPTRNDLPAYKYTIDLDGTTYQLSYFFNPRVNNGAGKWFLSLADANGKPLCGPVAIVATWDLLGRYVANGVPPGMIMAYDTSGQNQDPGQFDLGDRVRMVYLEAESV